MRSLLALLLLVWGSGPAPAPLTARLAKPAAPTRDGFHLGSSRAPNGATIGVDGRSLLRDGRRWTPVMGEFHFSRYPAAEWLTELRKMKAGGVDVVGTYVFWNHHEEIEGRWNWTGDRDLRRFVTLAKEAGLDVLVRIGPWCHGEVRYGGTPDWALAKGWRDRSDDPGYLEATRRLYAQIARQLRGLLWRDGGPVVGVQLENEFTGPAEHMLNLKRIAREVGLDVPLTTRTGWTPTSTPMPFGEILPLYGVYAEGFWDRELAPMPNDYWTGFTFVLLRSDASIDNARSGRAATGDAPDAERYPYLTCELGGGMTSAYHRRLRIDPADVEATALIRLGSGSNLLGYYMYQGGINPDGARTTLNETQANLWSDLPVKSYDFQAPLGAYGQIRPHYYLLRRLSLFLHDFGAGLAETDTVLPDARPSGYDDVETLRWAVRSDGERGFVFFNNHERGRELPPHAGVRFSLARSDGSTLAFPSTPVTIPSDAKGFWPFGMKLGDGVTLAWATAQPLCFEDDGATRTYYFAKTPGVATEFAVAAGDATPKVLAAHSGPAPVATERTRDGKTVRIVLVDEATSLRMTKENGRVRVAPIPPPERSVAVAAELVRPAGPAREVPLGVANPPVAAAPTDADFERASVWRIRLPAGLDLSTNPILRILYSGDVARVTIGGRLVLDDFFNGAPLEIGLARYAAALRRGGELRLEILPLRKDAPIGFSPASARPKGQGPTAELVSVVVVESGSVRAGHVRDASDRVARAR